MVVNALEKTKNMTLTVPWPLQVWVSPVQQVDDGVVHAELSLVRKLQWFHEVAILGPNAAFPLMGTVRIQHASAQ